MKKTIKITLAVICCLLVVFLLLPFLVPGARATEAVRAADETQQSAIPQIFTSNPLTKIVNRLAHLFQGKNRDTNPPQAETTPLTQAQTEARFGKAVSAQPDADDSGNAGAFTEPEELENSTNTTDVIQQNSEENWMLVKQTAPDTSADGMHEISVKDSPYEQLVKRERNARFIPGQVRRRRDVPDSKLARIFNPVKKFFGFDEGTPVAQTTPQAEWLASNASAVRTGATEGLGKSRDVSLPPANKGQWISPYSTGPMDPATEAERTLKFLNMISPQQSIQEAADMVADSKFPNPKTPQEQAKRDRLSRAKIEEYTALVNQKLRAYLDPRAAQEKAGDLSRTSLSCSGAFMENGQGVCSIETREEAEAKRVEILENFRLQTGIDLPVDVPVAVVLSKVKDPEQTIADLRKSVYSEGEEPDPAKDLMIEKYKFMIDQKKCSSSNPCYWVADNFPNTQEHLGFENTFHGAGIKFLGDPAQTSQALSDAFVQYKMENLSEEITPEQREEIFNEARNVHTPYLPLDLEELRKIQDDNKELLRQGQRTKDKSLIFKGKPLYAGSAKTAKDLDQDLHEPYVLYGIDNHVLDLAATPTMDLRVETLSQDLMNAVTVVREAIAPIKQQAAQEALRNSMETPMQEVKKETEQQIKTYNKTGAKPKIKDLINMYDDSYVKPED